MNNFFFIFLFIYAIFGCFLICGFYFQFKKEKKNFTSSSNLINTNQITVIIPFRNEKNNLPNLIESIQKQTILPFHFLFIDDHSTDDGMKIIGQLEKSIPYSVLKLPAGIQGKKTSIRYGIKNSTTEFILTIDADVQFEATYFSSLEKLSKKDLLILPVIMEGENWEEKLFELDYALSNSLNTAISGLTRPFIASGANLLFRKDVFLTFDSFEKHKHIFSGDDVFLLRDFQKNNCEIELITELSNAVYTNTPHTIKSFFEQRLRWIGKGSKVNDMQTNSLIVIIASIHLLFIIGTIYLTAKHEYIFLIVFFILKSGIEMLINYAYFSKIKQMNTWTLIPISSFLYPCYIATLLVLSATFKTKWKGRNIQS